MPYGFKKVDTINNGSDKLIHSENTINYPATHITNKIFNKHDLKSPLDREQAMLQGVVLDDDSIKANTSFTQNKNLLSKAYQSTNNATWKDKTHLNVEKNNGGITLTLPKTLANQYKDMYVEMDVELLAPDIEHSIGVNEYAQNRNMLSYKYRRFVTPVTMRVKASDQLKIRLTKGHYRLSIKGIYGEDYHTLKQASKSLKPVTISQFRSGYTFTKPKGTSGYLVVPIAYANGMHARVNGHDVDVKQANGIMTAIPVKKNDTHIELSYTPPHFYILLILSVIGIISSIIFSRYLKRKNQLK